MLSTLTRTVGHAWETRIVERQCSNVTCVGGGLEHAQNAGISQHVDACTHWRRGADRARSTSCRRDIASSAVAAADTGDGVGERHCAAFQGVLISERMRASASRWRSGGDGSVRQPSKKRMVEVLDSFPTVPI